MPVGEPSHTKDLLKLVTGTTIAQIIAVLASPLITRFFGPEAYGFFALFTSITGIVGVNACMRYQLAIMLPSDDREAASLLWVSLFFVLVISILMVPVLFFVGDALVAVLNAPGLGPYLVLMPPFVFIAGTFLALNSWNTRTRCFGRLSVARIISSAVTTGGQLAAGFTGRATGGSLIGASLAGSGVAAGLLAAQIWRDDRVLLRESLVWRQMRVEMYRYRKFPMIDSFSALLDAVSWQIPVFMLATFFSTVIVGYYSFGWRILQLPMSLIGAAIAQVFFQRAAEAYKSGALPGLVRTVVRVLLKVIILPVILLAVAGPDLFSVIFGAPWREAGVYVQILSIWAIFWFLYAPLGAIYVVLEKQDIGLKFNILNIAASFAGLAIGGLLGNVYLALALFALFGSLIYGGFSLLLIRMAGVALADAVGDMARIAAFALPWLAVILVARLLSASQSAIFVVACVLAMTYYGAVYFTDPQLRSFVRPS